MIINTWEQTFSVSMVYLFCLHITEANLDDPFLALHIK